MNTMIATRFQTAQESKDAFLAECDDLLLVEGVERGDTWYDRASEQFEEWKPEAAKSIKPVYTEDGGYNRRYEGYTTWSGKPLSPQMVIDRIVAGDARPFSEELVKEERAARLDERAKIVKREWVSRFKSLLQESRYIERERYQNAYELVREVGNSAHLLRIVRLLQENSPRDLESLYEIGISEIPSDWVQSHSQGAARQLVLREYFTRGEAESLYRGTSPRGNTFLDDSNTRQFLVPIEYRSSLEKLEEYYNMTRESYIQSIHEFVQAVEACEKGE